MKLEIIKNTIQSSNINFLIGSGLSRPYLITLGNIESLLEELDKDDTLDTLECYLIKASIYKVYFEQVMNKCLDDYVKTKDEEILYKEVIGNYEDFLLNINVILLNRYTPILNKQVNLFTTNIDLFFEKALEITMVEFNDGFKGRLKPIFNLSNFQKSYNKTSLHYKNTSEIPVFNLNKLHGSLSWKQEKKQIIFSNQKEFIDVRNSLAKFNTNCFIAIDKKDGLSNLVPKAKTKIKGLGKTQKDDVLNKIMDFFSTYDELQIVNPTKEKFKTTILNNYYYELLRLFANEMEKENSVLFVLGFSFADEHIREITIRAANSNPTLQVYVVAYSENSKKDISETLGISKNHLHNNNLKIIDPVDFYTNNKEDMDIKSFTEFGFSEINEMIFSHIKNKVTPKII
ncbi:SIR2 family protein [Euzebyella saccharophila]|uniref:SIR2 family protein n=1 Tax=Euzebyella saccharophila TaxID=679664 RepID=A0ABV8JKZ2_9FLAO|nr:SIR2 family protein [Euzebyella saccharophila]